MNTEELKTFITLCKVKNFTLAAEQMLRDAGVIVTKSNYESTKLASAFLNALEERG